MVDLSKYGHWPDHWHIKFFGYGEADSGDVVTRDGEIIGIWSSDENGHCSFTPNGFEAPILFDVFLGRLCSAITEWHEGAASRLAIS